MAQIKVLPPEVAHKIAAGEVIERPASCVKELVENSIDAGATQITVEIQGGGLELIRVQDNGSGIARDDLELAFEPHATSKIERAEDLFALYTLGFRGEALPSMASIAKLTLVSRPADQKNGYKIWQKQGKWVVEPEGTPPGTTVEVRELFYNVPARLKFLRSAAAERRQVLELCTKMALAQPHIAFRIAAEGKLVLATPGSGRLLDTILLVHGGNVAQELIKFQASYAWGQVQGYLGSPRLAKGNRSGQIFIMNGRVIQNQTLRVALEKAYHGLLPSRAFPWALLAVELRPELVDCNVHPAKAEVRFAQEQVMFSDILQAVRSGLSRQNLAPTLQQTETPRKSMPARTAPQTQLKWEPETWQHMDELLKSYRAKREDREQREQDFMVQESKEPFLSQAPSGKDEDLRSHLRTGRIIGQLHQTYILLEVPEGLWLLDQHIVHERILLEELEASFENATLHIQEILPQHLEFTPSEAALVEESVDRLREFGLELEAFGQNSFLLRAVPSTLAHSGGNWKEEILEIASTSKKTTSQKQEALITLACKGAVKAGEYLDENVIRALLNRLAEAKNPFTCPHGRPIIVRLENHELSRRFGRT
ncbi:MAG: DNA mismatch repair endonuclease MutL [Bacillota bacterium]|jgi:DNA mismatch repair protein MutL|nr:DNA mismatch repair endonuclease MutL [Bacillota bacterium]HHT91063.1 DNA mismatch repair endonuclease MutL [Bacillota bacterium]